MIVKLLIEQHLEFLSLKRGCTGSSESTLIKMPHCWKSHVAAQICSMLSVCSLQLSCIVLFISHATLDFAIQCTCTNHPTVLSGKVRYMVETEFYGWPYTME